MRLVEGSRRIGICGRFEVKAHEPVFLGRRLGIPGFLRNRDAVGVAIALALLASGAANASDKSDAIIIDNFAPHVWQGTGAARTGTRITWHSGQTRR